MMERAAYEAQFRSAEHRFYQNAAQERLNVEAAVGQQFLALWQELQEAKQEYTQNLRLEARRLADERMSRLYRGAAVSSNCTGSGSISPGCREGLAS